MTTSERDKQLVNITCSECGAPITIKYGTYRKTKNKPHFCIKCQGKNQSKRYAEMTDEQRKEFGAKVSEGIRNMSDEQRQAISESRRESWANDPERHEKTSQMLSERWNKMSENEKQNQVNKLINGQKKFWSDPDNRQKQSDLHRELFYKQIDTPEKLARFMEVNVGALKKWRENATPEDLYEEYKKKSAASKEAWSNVSKEEKERRMKLLKAGRFSDSDNKAETKVIDILNENSIKFIRYCFNQIEHPDFYELFPSKSDGTRPGSMWFHQWDILIKTNNGLVFVDVDGSIHDPSKNVDATYPDKYYMSRDYISFKASQRPYQTDGLEAYIIKAYTDTVTYDTEVVSVYDENNKMTLREFVKYIKSRPLVDDERQHAIDKLFNKYENDEIRMRFITK